MYIMDNVVIAVRKGDIFYAVPMCHTAPYCGLADGRRTVMYIIIYITKMQNRGTQE